MEMKWHLTEGSGPGVESYTKVVNSVYCGLARTRLDSVAVLCECHRGLSPVMQTRSSITFCLCGNGVGFS
jgi:hypothetical protein